MPPLHGSPLAVDHQDDADGSGGRGGGGSANAAAVHWSSAPLPDRVLQGGVDSDHLGRQQEGLIERLWADPGTLVLPLHEGRALVDAEGRLALLAPETVGAASMKLYLGRITATEGVPDDGILVAGGAGMTPVLAVVVEGPEALQLPGEWAGLRAVGAALDARDLGLFTRAQALLNWHEGNAYSPRTGGQTEVRNGGWVRVEPETGHELFPRTDPAVIVAITDEADHLLLGSNMLWEQHRFSLVAGFVDPGESLEQAVVREVLEETGLSSRAPRYLGSQPWPFPASLMLGFQATVSGIRPEAVADGVELRELRWFSRSELAAAAASDAVLLPGSASIARAIVEHWYGGRLPQGR